MASGGNVEEDVKCDNLENADASSSELVSDEPASSNELVSVDPTSSNELDCITPVEDTTLTPELRNSVFGNELLTDLIFDYVFSPVERRKTLSIGDVRTCRQVEHAWLDFISRRFRKEKISPIGVDFSYWTKSKEQQSHHERRYQIHNFLETWANFPDAGSRVPLYRLDFHQAYPINTVEKGEVRDLIKCLTLCGNGLYGLILDLSNRFLLDDDDDNDNDDNPMDFAAALDTMHLPNLVDVDIYLPHTESNQVLINMLVTPIMSSCKRLKRLSLQKRYRIGVLINRLFSKQGRSEYLPDTLEAISIDVNLTLPLLANLLLGNSLPYLTQLKLFTWEGGYSDVITRILERFSQQLKFFFCKLYLKPEGQDWHGSSTASSTLVKFPVMAKLNELFVCSLHCKHDPELDHSFPVLEIMHLSDQTSFTVQKWMSRNSQFISVKDLILTIWTSQYTNETILTKYAIENSFTLELSRQLPTAFPNVQRLDLTVGSAMEEGAIQNIFKHMTQLRHLHIRFKNIGDVVRTYTWDGILLGISTAFAKTLTKRRDHWWSTNLDDIRSRTESIVNLQELKSLLLEEAGKEGMTAPLISDISFQFGFLCMPNLKKLILEGRFQASDSMKKRWKWSKGGREIRVRNYQRLWYGEP